MAARHSYCSGMGCKLFRIRILFQDYQRQKDYQDYVVNSYGACLFRLAGLPGYIGAVGADGRYIGAVGAIIGPALRVLASKG